LTLRVSATLPPGENGSASEVGHGGVEGERVHAAADEVADHPAIVSASIRGVS
jgi:hypothetical protein